MFKSLLLKFLLAVVFLFFFGDDLIAHHWEGVLVCFAAILLVPIGLQLIGVRKLFIQIAEVGAFFLLPAYCFHGILNTHFFILPYCLSIFVITVFYIFNFIENIKFKSLVEWLPLFALGYLVVGAGWLFCFIFGINPLEFNNVIVGLTAAHFHLAGFVLTVHVWQLVQQSSVKNKWLLTISPLVGMSLVATGITMTKMGFPFQIEMIGSLVFIVFVLVSIWELFRFSKTQNGIQKFLFIMAGLSLSFTMILAAIYAIRFVWPHSFFNIPNMKIWHGTINVFGFGLAALVGWRLNERRDEEVQRS